MGKSYKDLNKQPKKIGAGKNLRVRYEEDEAEQDIKKYNGQSFSMVRKDEEED
jgi:hypothetical protein